MAMGDAIAGSHAWTSHTALLFIVASVGSGESVCGGWGAQRAE
jgi:hypothetical protein